MEPLNSPVRRGTLRRNDGNSVEKLGVNIASSIFKVVKTSKLVKGYSFLSKLPSARETVDEIIEARVPTN